MYLKLSSMIEGQLRDAYAKKHDAGALNQSSLADKLGVNRSAVHHRLTGRTNMTLETIADMVWGMDQDIELKIFDPTDSAKNRRVPEPTLDTFPLEESVTANSPLMKIASSPPSSNTTPQPLGGLQKERPPQTPQSYSAQLFGQK
jgi:hypothetical protein